jgi:hypothetical protein
MLVYMQFQVSLGSSIGDAGVVVKHTALAWPSENKSGLYLTHEPLLSIGYGSEAVAIADLDRWLAKFPCIVEAETVMLSDEA